MAFCTIKTFTVADTTCFTLTVVLLHKQKENGLHVADPHVPSDDDTAARWQGVRRSAYAGALRALTSSGPKARPLHGLIVTHLPAVPIFPLSAE